jgi:adenylate cyclase
MSVLDIGTWNATPGLASQIASMFRINQPKKADFAPRCGAAAKTCGVAARLRAQEARTREIERAFSRYISPALVERLMADPDGAAPGGEVRDVTVLFADMRGFTAVAEALKDDPGRLGDLIGALHAPLTEIIVAHGGTIDKYMGDCVMAFWGAPTPDADHARHAVEAAHAVLAAMDEINRTLRFDFPELHDLPPIQLGLGINTGACMVGNLGCSRRLEYSVLGDPVNIASRLERLTKVYKTHLLVGEETVRRLGEGAGLKEIDRIAVRGRQGVQGVFALA